MAYNFSNLPDVLQRSLKGKIYPGVSMRSAENNIRRTINNYNSANNTNFSIPGVQEAFDWRGISYADDMQKAAEYNRANLSPNHVVNQYGGSPTASQATADFSVSPDLGANRAQQEANYHDWMSGMTDADRIRAATLGASPMNEAEWQRWKTAETSPFAGLPTHTVGDVHINPRNQWASPPASQPQPQPGPYTPSSMLQPYVPPTMGGGNTGAGNAGMPNPQPTGGPGPQSTGGPMIGTMGGPGYGPNPLGSAGPGGEVWNYYQQNGGLLGGQQQSYQPQTGLFSPNTDNPGGWEAIMHQQFNSMPHIANPRAPEVTLGGSWLNAGDTMRIPSNLMGNVPGLFGGMNQQTQWGGYWGPELTGMVGPHGIAPGYGFYNSNSPVNYTGLFSQSNPFWGNPVASPAFPTPSPQTLSPYMGVGPQSHFGQYFQRMRQNAGTLQQTREAQEQDRQQQQVDWQYAMHGCDQGDDACLRQAQMNYG